MFTGIIQEIGTVSAVVQIGKGLRITVKSPRTAPDLRLGDSVSISGACQTVVDLKADSFVVEAVEETLKKTTFKDLKASSRVNIELPVRLSDRLGGHLVLGHVDTVGKMASIRKRSASWLISIAHDAVFMKYLVPVGSVAVDGISLTVASLTESGFVVSIIPHTLEQTILSEAHSGLLVNLEFDILGKYLERLAFQRGRGSLTNEELKSWGYKLDSDSVIP